MTILLLATVFCCVLQSLAFRGSCPLGRKCQDIVQHSKFRSLGYTECKRTAELLVTKAGECMKKEFQDIIEKKTCGCTGESLSPQIYALTKSAPELAQIYACMKFKDIRLSSCPAIVRTCERLAKEASRHTSIFQFGRTCDAKALEYKGKLEDCLEDMMTADLSGCGSIQDVVKQFGPFVKILLQVHCSGCDIPELVDTCGRTYKERRRRDPCGYTKIADHMESCFKQQMQSRSNCKALAPILSATWQQIKEETLVKVIYEGCQIQKSYESEQATWGCGSDAKKRDSPTPTEFLTPTRSDFKRSLEDLWTSLTEQ